MNGGLHVIKPQRILDNVDGQVVVTLRTSILLVCFCHTLSPSRYGQVGQHVNMFRGLRRVVNVSLGISIIKCGKLRGITSTSLSTPVVDPQVDVETRGKRIEFGGDARELMLKGVERIAKAVGVTLGPKGRNVIIRQRNAEPKITKDGVTVAKSIEFTNQFEDVGAKLIRQVASKTNDLAGDGTTAATILAWSIFAEGYKAVATGGNPMDLKRGIDNAVDVLLANLEKQKREVCDVATLENVATISANGEKELGRQIAAAVLAVGTEGYVRVCDGTSPTTDWTQHEGWSTEHGFAHNLLVTDRERLGVVLNNAIVFISKTPLKSLEDVERLLGHAKSRNQPLMLVAPDICGDALETLILNQASGTVQVGAVRIPYEEGAYEDLAITCGCSVQTNDVVAKVGVLQPILGHAVRVTQSMDATVFATNTNVSQHVRHLRFQYDRTLSEVDREHLCERIAKLTRKYAVIRVGGRSQVEISESKDRVVDALNSARAALEEGIVAGGGAALLHASKDLDRLLEADQEMIQDRRAGILIVRNACRLPNCLIADNAGVEGAVIVDNVAEQSNTAMGYDAQNDQYTDMFVAGIVDPIRVVRCCIVNAASVAGLMITTEASVCDDDHSVHAASDSTPMVSFR